MSDMIKVTIDGQQIEVKKGTTLLDAAASIGIEIPIICYHPHLTGNGLCRICSCDTGGRVQSAACVTDCWDGMDVKTDTEAVNTGRKTILELLASTVDLSEAPEIQQLMTEYAAEPARLEGKRRETPIYDDNPFFVRDYNQCINCWRCVQVCADDAQFTYALSFNGRGFETTIATFDDSAMPDTTCVFCGQCVGACPTGALKPKREALYEEGVNADEIFYETRPRMKRRKEKSE